MKLAVAVFTSSLLMSGSAFAEGNPFVGSWLSEPLPGVAGFRQLTFTQTGQLIADRAVLGAYQVRGSSVAARSSFGETYTYELLKDGRLCTKSGPGMTPLATTPQAGSSYGLCFKRRLALPG